MAIVYQHIRPDKNEIFYVGIGKTIKRAYTTKGRNKLWQAIVKRNPDYIINIIYDNLTWEEACKIEVELIERIGRINTGTGTLCNLTDGGEGVLGVVQSTYTRLKRSLSLSGENNPNFGKPLPEWHKEINRNVQLGKKHSKERIEKMKKAITGQKRQFSEEGMQKLKNVVSKQVIDTKTNKIFKNIKEAALYLNMKRTTLNAMLAGQSRNKTNIVYMSDFKKLTNE